MTFRQFVDLCAYFAAGFGLGWLVGMSMSPVIQGLITALTGLVVMMLGVFSAPETPGAREGHRPRPLPAALLIVGITSGSVLGIYTRTKNWLGQSDAEIVREWTALGLERKDVVQRLFDNQFSKEATAGSKNADVVRDWTALGLEKREVVQKLFDYQFSKEATAGTKNNERRTLDAPKAEPKAEPAPGPTISRRTGALIAGEMPSDWKAKVCTEVKYISVAKDAVDRKPHEDRLKELLIEGPDMAFRARVRRNLEDPDLLLLMAEAICFP